MSATIAYGRQAVALGEVMGDAEDKSLFATTLIGLATSTRAAGDDQTAFEIGERIIQLLRAVGDAYRLGRVLIMQAGNRDGSQQIGYRSYLARRSTPACPSGRG